MSHVPLSPSTLYPNLPNLTSLIQSKHLNPLQSHLSTLKSPYCRDNGPRRAFEEHVAYHERHRRDGRMSALPQRIMGQNHAGTSIAISLHNLSQNWRQYLMSATWHSLLLNVRNPVLVGHILRNCIGEAQESATVANASATESNSNLASPNVARGTKKFYWLFDDLEHLMELLACGCLAHTCIGIVKHMPQIIYGMHLGVHHWVFDSRDTLKKIISAYKSQYISLKDTLRPILRITIHLEDKYKNLGLNVKYQERELQEILTLCHLHGMNLHGVVIELPSPWVGCASAPSTAQQPSKAPNPIAQLRRGFRYLEIICDECVKANLRKPEMILVRTMGCMPPDDIFSVHSESSRIELNHQLEDALRLATGRSNAGPTTDIETWLQPLQELTNLSKQWKEIDAEHHIRLIADPTQFLLSNTHSLSVKILSVSRKSFWKPKKVYFVVTQNGVSMDVRSAKSKAQYSEYQEVHLSEGVAFLFSMRLRGLVFKPYLESLGGGNSPAASGGGQEQTPDATTATSAQHSAPQTLELIPTIIYGDCSHYDPCDCLNLFRATSHDADEPIFFALPRLTEADKLRFEGLGMFEHLFARSGLLEHRERKYPTTYITSAKRSRM